MELRDAFGTAVRKIRLSRGLAQDAIGPSQAYISEIERAVKSPTLEKMQGIAEALDVHLVTILVCAFAESGQPATELLTLVKKQLRVQGLWDHELDIK
ncbi:hypothetical protein PS838_00219 [Pseudomonas fluorescens]|nr:hypothetical protein PS838_00219 [Pseudomonas fluorescens]